MKCKNITYLFTIILIASCGKNSEDLKKNILGKWSAKEERIWMDSLGNIDHDSIYFDITFSSSDTAKILGFRKVGNEKIYEADSLTQYRTYEFRESENSLNQLIFTTSTKIIGLPFPEILLIDEFDIYTFEENEVILKNSLDSTNIWVLERVQ